MGRAPCCDKASVKKGPWSPEEDAKLKAYIEQHGTGGNWIALPQKIGLKRCGKSCRLRWLNYLRPNIKHGGFTEEEDNIICGLYISIGSRWSIIAAQLPGRTDNDIKNYWNTRLKKKLLGRRKESQMRLLSATNHEAAEVNGTSENSNQPALSSSALDRMQLHMQLQGLHSPFSYYNNPTLWPKYYALGEKMSQNQYNEVGTVFPPHNRCETLVRTPTVGAPVSQIEPPPNGKFDNLAMPSTDPLQEHLTTRNRNPEEIENSPNGFSSSFESASRATISKVDNLDQLIMNFHTETGLHPELNDFLYNRAGSFDGSEDRIYELDSFKDITGTKEKINWWANDFDTKSSSNSWDSSSILQPHEMFQEYVMGYDL